MATWILTGSLKNFRINVERGFDVIGFKERRRNQALEFEPGDEIVFYVTGVQAFGAIARVRSEMFEDRTPIWPQGRRSGRRTTRGGSRPSRWRSSTRTSSCRPSRSPTSSSMSASGLPSTGISPSRASCARSRTPTRSCCGERIAAAAGVAAAPVIHERHFTSRRRTPCCRGSSRRCAALREARDRLTDAEAHEALADAAPDQRRRRAGPRASARRSSRSGLLAELQELGLVVRDIDRGLIDFPTILDGREAYLCWQLDEDEIGFWHDLESGYGGRQPLD